jgi:hypothetical protein
MPNVVVIVAAMLGFREWLFGVLVVYLGTKRAKFATPVRGAYKK